MFVFVVYIIINTIIIITTTTTMATMENYLDDKTSKLANMDKCEIDDLSMASVTPLGTTTMGETNENENAPNDNNNNDTNDNNNNNNNLDKLNFENFENDNAPNDNNNNDTNGTNNNNNNVMKLDFVPNGNGNGPSLLGAFTPNSGAFIPNPGPYQPKALSKRGAFISNLGANGSGQVFGGESFNQAFGGGVAFISNRGGGAVWSPSGNGGGPGFGGDSGNGGGPGVGASVSVGASPAKPKKIGLRNMNAQTQKLLSMQNDRNGQTLKYKTDMDTRLALLTHLDEATKNEVIKEYKKIFQSHNDFERILITVGTAANNIKNLIGQSKKFIKELLGATTPYTQDFINMAMTYVEYGTDRAALRKVAEMIEANAAKQEKRKQDKNENMIEKDKKRIEMEMKMEEMQARMAEKDKELERLRNDKNNNNNSDNNSDNDKSMRFIRGSAVGMDSEKEATPRGDDTGTLLDELISKMEDYGVFETPQLHRDFMEIIKELKRQVLLLAIVPGNQNIAQRLTEAGFNIFNTMGMESGESYNVLTNSQALINMVKDEKDSDGSYHESMD